MTLFADDRDLLATWAVHGVPDDGSTRDWICDDLVLRLYADALEHRQIVRELVDSLTPDIEHLASQRSSALRRDDGRPILVGRDVPSQEQLAEAEAQGVLL